MLSKYIYIEYVMTITVQPLKKNRYMKSIILNYAKNAYNIILI